MLKFFIETQIKKGRSEIQILIAAKEKYNLSTKEVDVVLKPMIKGETK